MSAIVSRSKVWLPHKSLLRVFFAEVASPIEERFDTAKVESRCGAVALGCTYLLPPLSFGGALVV
jgi:hypothetical protein